jgi:hypothetical protein
MNEPVADALGQNGIPQVHVLGLHEGQGQFLGGERPLDQRDLLLMLAFVGVIALLVGWASYDPTPNNCPAPSPRSVEDPFAPCLEQQAMNNSAPEAVR